MSQNLKHSTCCHCIVRITSGYGPDQGSSIPSHAPNTMPLTCNPQVCWRKARVPFGLRICTYMCLSFSKKKLLTTRSSQSRWKSQCLTHTYTHISTTLSPVAETGKENPRKVVSKARIPLGCNGGLITSIKVLNPMYLGSESRTSPGSRGLRAGRGQTKGV